MDGSGQTIGADKVARAEQALRERISANTWPAGSRLPTERVLAGELGIARNTLRLALGRLETDGLIRRHVGRGTYVAETAGVAARGGTGDDGLDGAAGDLSAAIIAASPADIMEVRLFLEPQAAALAAVRASAAEISAIEMALQRCLAADSILAFEAADGELHRLIMHGARNDLLERIGAAMQAVRRQPRWIALKTRVLTNDLRERHNREHGDIVRAIAARDPDGARTACVAHVRSVRRQLPGLET